jgi:hypothetical protein
MNLFDQVKDNSKTSFSVMFACRGTGAILPPMCALKSPSGYFYDTWARGGPEGSVWTANKAGWFNMRECETWFEKVFLKYLEDQKIPKQEIKVLIMDNLSSHISFSIMEQAKENNIRLVFLPPNSTHITQPLDVAVFAPLKKQWRKELDNYKEYCVHNNVRSTTVPKDKFASLLKATLENNTVNNASNVRAGFAACGIIPFSPDRVLAKLPPEETAKQGVQDDLSKQLLDQLKKVRYGDQEKSKRAKKANRLPPGTAYTVSAVPATEEPVAGPSSAVAGSSGDSGGCNRFQGGRGGGRRSESWQDRPNFYSSSDEDDVEEGEESQESEDSEDSEDSQDGEISEDNRDSDGGEEEEEVQMEADTEKEMFEVGDFVAAVYEGVWLLAQVDIDQDKAGDTHVNLTYMERVGKNQFKWPKQEDRLLTLREDILFKCDAPILVGSSIRACHVGLPGKLAVQADAALDLVVYLQLILFPSLKNFFVLQFLMKTLKFDFYF